MPTGYTAVISEGISFKEFVLICARAFGATITMRDEPLEKEIPDEFEPSDYHEKRLKEARARLAELRSLPKEKLDILALDEWNKDERNRIDSLNDKRELKNKYKAMLADVELWTPPTVDHEELKNFMVKQITESISFDCNESYYQTPTAKLTGADWLEKEIGNAIRDIEYHLKEHKEEVDRTTERNKWVKKLRMSLEV